MGLKDVVIAIPSYKRSELLRDQTLRVLSEYNIPQNRIYVFVANKEEENIYLNVLMLTYAFAFYILKYIPLK